MLIRDGGHLLLKFPELTFDFYEPFDYFPIVTQLKVSFEAPSHEHVMSQMVPDALELGKPCR